ncbi:hypothetical protein AVEN_38576-1, partial [Araneus ventricosus]
PRALKKGKISIIWPLKDQYGNPVLDSYVNGNLECKFWEEKESGWNGRFECGVPPLQINGGPPAATSCQRLGSMRRLKGAVVWPTHRMMAIREGCPLGRSGRTQDTALGR